MPLEGGKPQTIACPMSEEQKELQAGLIKRYDRLRSEKVDPREDNALAITTDGRKLALDGRMYGSSRVPRLGDLIALGQERGEDLGTLGG